MKNSCKSAKSRLSTTIEAIEKKLRDLELGIETWIWFGYGPSEKPGYRYKVDLGFAPYENAWSLVTRPCYSLRKLRSFVELDEKKEIFRLSEVPTGLQSAAIRVVPTLISKIQNEQAALEKAFESTAGFVQQLN